MGSTGCLGCCHTWHAALGLGPTAPAQPFTSSTTVPPHCPATTATSCLQHRRRCFPGAVARVCGASTLHQVRARARCNSHGTGTPSPMPRSQSGSASGAQPGAGSLQKGGPRGGLPFRSLEPSWKAPVGAMNMRQALASLAAAASSSSSSSVPTGAPVAVAAGGEVESATSAEAPAGRGAVAAPKTAPATVLDPATVPAPSTVSAAATAPAAGQVTDPATVPAAAASILEASEAPAVTVPEEAEAAAAAAAAAAVAEATAVPRPGPEEAAAAEVDQFVWDEAWYPVGVLQDFDKALPTAVTIFGLPLVVWWDRNTAPGGTGKGEGGRMNSTVRGEGEGKDGRARSTVQGEGAGAGEGGAWRVFHDLCPHRLAPLSQGRIHESGGLQCSYHGWTFQGDGGCSLIPQQDADRPQACRSKKACARVYPSREHQGLLWFWPQLAPQAQAQADATPLPTVAALEDPAFSHVQGQIDVNYGQELLVENLMDPAHVPFAHHSIGSQAFREDGRALDFFVRSVGKWGVLLEGLEYEQYRFHAPCLVTSVGTAGRFRKGKEKHRQRREVVQGSGSHLESVRERAEEFAAASDDKRIVAAFWCVPRKPGSSRFIFAFAFNFLPSFARHIPRWFLHLNPMAVLESDHHLLHLLERRLQDEGGQQRAMSAYFTPTRSDAPVMAYRHWLKTRAGGQVHWPRTVDPALPPALPRRQLMDRQQNHVSICKSCKNSMMWMERIALVLQVGAFLSLGGLLLASALKTGQLSAPFVLGTLVASTMCAAGSEFLKRLSTRAFVFKDYVHALVK